MSRPHAGTLIIGGGLAGTRCATTLRSLGYEHPITVIGDEPDMAYERPALSKQYLAGERTTDSLALQPAQTYQDLGIRFITDDPVVAIDHHHRRVVTAAGDHHHYASLVMASGAAARTLGGESSWSNVGTLRTRADADHLRASLRPGGQLVIVGCGFVGAEVASTASNMGVHVTVLEAGSAPFGALLGSEVGAVMLAHYRTSGITVHTDAMVTHLDGRNGLAHRVDLQDGSSYACDAVLVSIGSVPRDELYWSIDHAALGVRLPGGGIPVDPVGRTAVPDVYACGDVAAPWRAQEQTYRRIEHWTEAAAQGVAVAHTIAGCSAPAPPIPYVWSDQFGLRLQYAGDGRGAARVVMESAEPGQLFVRYHDDAGRMMGVLGANRPRDIARLREELART